MANGSLCNVTAVERCSSCYKAYCAAHQARDVNTIGIIIRTYTSWCLACQQKREAEEKAASQAATEAAAQRRRAAAERVPQLLAEFRSRPFAGAKARPWTQVIDKGPKFLGGGHRIKKIQHFDEPAVPIGQLRWTFYFNRMHPDISDKNQNAILDTGLTASGEFVPMNAEPLHSSYGNHDYQLATFQEEAICVALESLLDRG